MLIDHHRAETRLNTFRESDFISSSDHEERRVWFFDTLLGAKEDEPYIDTWVSDEMADKLEKAIETLPLAQKELVTMRYYRNMTYKEIVLETGEKQANLLPRMFHAKKNLRKILCND